MPSLGNCDWYPVDELTRVPGFPDTIGGVREKARKAGWPMRIKRHLGFKNTITEIQRGFLPQFVQEWMATAGPTTDNGFAAVIEHGQSMRVEDLVGQVSRILSNMQLVAGWTGAQQAVAVFQHLWGLGVAQDFLGSSIDDHTMAGLPEDAIRTPGILIGNIIPTRTHPDIAYTVFATAMVDAFGEHTTFTVCPHAQFITFMREM